MTESGSLRAVRLPDWYADAAAVAVEDAARDVLVEAMAVARGSRKDIESYAPPEIRRRAAAALAALFDKCYRAGRERGGDR